MHLILVCVTRSPQDPAKEFTADDEYLGRFRQAFAASSLNHPNILTVFDIEVVDETYLIATELVQGETLRKRMAKVFFPLSKP